MAFVDVEKMDNNVAVMYWDHEEQNRFTASFCLEIISKIDELAKDDKVNSVVVTGRQEKFFSTGLYLDWLAEEARRNPQNIPDFLQTIIALNKKIVGFPKPLIAAINGHAVAQGCIVCAFMDFRFMRDDQGFISLPEVLIGIPFLPSMILLFQQILSGRSFRDLAYTGRRYTSAEAKELGYIDKLCDADSLVPEAVEFAGNLGSTINRNNYMNIKLFNRRDVLVAMDKEDPLQIDRISEIIHSGM